MNEDYAHLLPRGDVDYKLLGQLLTRAMRRRKHSFRKAGKVIGIDHHTVSIVAGGGRCNFGTGLKVCIYLDLNPLEILKDVSREIVSSPPSDGVRADG